MLRRAFLGALGALPFLGWLKPAGEMEATGCDHSKQWLGSVSLHTRAHQPHDYPGYDPTKPQVLMVIGGQVRYCNINLGAPPEVNRG